ncbi:MAG: hypothetical protein AAFW73_26480 [Bacteroidota bacterium]
MNAALLFNSLGLINIIRIGFNEQLGTDYRPGGERVLCLPVSDMFRPSSLSTAYVTPMYSNGVYQSWQYEDQVRVLTLAEPTLLGLACVRRHRILTAKLPRTTTTSTTTIPPTSTNSPTKNSNWAEGTSAQRTTSSDSAESLWSSLRNAENSRQDTLASNGKKLQIEV